jgi:hypothetical protein
MILWTFFIDLLLYTLFRCNLVLNIIINKAIKTKRNLLITALMAVILIAAVNVQRAAALTFVPWEKLHPEDFVNDEDDNNGYDRHNEKYFNPWVREYELKVKNNDRLYNIPEFHNKQEGLVNQNTQIN